MNELLYLDSEKESVMTVIPLADLLNIRQNLPHSTTALPSATTTLYPEIPEGELLNSLHRATIIATDEKIEANITPSNWEDKYNFPFCLKVSVTSRPVNWGEDLIDLESTILKRRSTRAYSGASLSLDELRACCISPINPKIMPAKISIPIPIILLWIYWKLLSLFRQ